MVVLHLGAKFVEYIHTQPSVWMSSKSAKEITLVQVCSIGAVALLAALPQQ